MRQTIHLLASAALLVQLPALAATPFTSNHPEEAYPDEAPLMVSPGEHADFIRQVQTRLHERGFDAGPVNGDFGAKTQAALAQFQISTSLPASGMLDERTLRELGMPRPPS